MKNMFSAFRLPNAFLVPVAIVFSLLSADAVQAQTYPQSIQSRVRPWYKHHKDGSPGREVTLLFKGGKLAGPANVRVEAEGKVNQYTIDQQPGLDTLAVLLPTGVGVDKETQAFITVKTPQTEFYTSAWVRPQRYWTVYVYPHSHVDIGYTNTQEFVRKLHMKNIDVAIDIARKTQNYPDGSRFVWNPEATWVVENYWKGASEKKRKEFVEAVKKGWISLDADYGNINTSATTDEQLFRLFHKGHEISKATGTPLKTAVQMDVAGISWGTVQAAYQNGVKGFFLYPNIGTVRYPWEHRPFYWVAPDGKSKIFFLQGLPYGFGWDIKGIKIGLGKVQNQNLALDRITTANPTANFLDPLVFKEAAMQEAYQSPYSILVVPWALADNALIDADLPDAVRLWNEKYAYPKVIISGSQRILDDYEKRYSNIIPHFKGDYSEYWTDGLGSDARRIGLYRQAPENLVQMEAAWSMLNAGKSAPRAMIDSSWRASLLGAEHTWGYQDPEAPLAKKIEATKAAFFEDTYTTSRNLLAQTFKSIQNNNSNKIAIFNTLSWQRSGLITLNKEQSRFGDRVEDEKGTVVPSQRLSTGQLAFWAQDVPSLGTKQFVVTAGKPAAVSGCSLNDNKLSNGSISLVIDKKTGDINSFVAVKTGHNYVDSKSEYGINSYRYLLGKDSTNKGSAPEKVKLKVKEDGPLVVSIVVEAEADGVRWLKREVQLVKGQPWADIVNSFDKISTRTKEGIHFGFAFNIPGGNARLDIPWGTMVPEADQLFGGNRSWLTFQRWVDISNHENGVTWTCIESPLIEIGSMTANLLGGAHGRQNWYKRLDKTQTMFSWVVNNHWGTNFPLEQGGPMSFRYAILPHQAYNAVTTNRFGLEMNRPLLAVPVNSKPVTKSCVSIGNPNIMLSMLKQSDDGKGIVVRFKSVSGKPEQLKLSWPNGKPRKVYTCLADEKPVAPAAGSAVMLPYGVLSYYFQP